MNDMAAQAYDAARNRLVRDFTAEFCAADGRVNWPKLVAFNAAINPPALTLR